MNGASDVGGAAIFLFLLFGTLYLIPTIIGLLRKHKDLPAIAAVNILFGWSVVGWFMSLIWALADPAGRGRGNQTVVINTSQSNVAADTVRYQPQPAPSPPPPPHPGAGALADPDTAFWDGLRDKNDPDLLEEYLIRFPGGRFAQLARNKLERTGSRSPTVSNGASAANGDVNWAPPSALVEPPAPRAPVCSGCGAAWEPGSRFCGDCGAPAGEAAHA
ncbi:MAG: superinfection immunity protein [Caulobacteraceae bacterium]